MTDKGFFDETTEQSIVKAAIVSKYLWAWAKVISRSVRRPGGKIAYVDLFSGPGRYKDGTDSTPLLVLKKAMEDPELSQMLVTVFNDKDKQNCHYLETAISQIRGIDTLRHKPIISNYEVGTEMVKLLEQMKLVPTLFFVDPWGYKGLSLKLVNAVVKDWGCECIFFFNYNRIRMGLSNPIVADHINSLLGRKRADALRQKLANLSAPAERELTIVEALCEAINPDGQRFVLPFRFLSKQGTRTSHHLIFVTKHFRGYEIMKEIMARESSSRQQGVPSFEYNPSDRRFPLLFDLARPLDDLEELLLVEFAGRTINFKSLYETHSVGRPFIKSNYKECLRRLETKGRVSAVKPNGKRRRGTFADDVIITFPTKGA